MKLNSFINFLNSRIDMYIEKYGFGVKSAIIAQAILESGVHNIENETGLFRYNNFWGLKCGGAWTGKSVNMMTQEEYETGTLTDIAANFRVYDNMESGVEGYFEFLNWSRYFNLKCIKNPLEYLQTIHNDGFATSSNYSDNCMRVLYSYGLDSVDSAPEFDIEELAQQVIRGEFGNGAERRERLNSMSNGLYDRVQHRVNEIMSVENISIDDYAWATIRGEFGNGDERRERLNSIKDGLWDVVQARVDELYTLNDMFND